MTSQEPYLDYSSAAVDGFVALSKQSAKADTRMDGRRSQCGLSNHFRRLKSTSGPSWTVFPLQRSALESRLVIFRSRRLNGMPAPCRTPNLDTDFPYLNALVIASRCDTRSLMSSCTLVLP